MTYLGQKYPVKVLGLSVGEVGITWGTAKGTVVGLKKLEDFPATSPLEVQEGWWRR